MIKIDKLNPFGRMCVSMGMLPSSYSESLTYEEQLLWFCNFLEKVVIPAVNKEEEAIEELQALYIELKEYVDSYFDNLDVQEEINNKLDDMAESGQLTDIIAQYLELAGILSYNNVSELKNAENLVEGSKVKTYGYYSYNDGGGAYYKVRTITNEDVVDDMTIIALNDVSLVAEYINNKDYINPLEFGAKKDLTFDSKNAIQKAINLGNVKFSKGSYYVSDTINIPSVRIIDGNMSIIVGEENKPVFKVGTSETGVLNQQVIIKNFIINSEDTSCSGISVLNSYLITLENIRVMRLSGENSYCFYFLNGFNLTIRNCSGYGLDYATGQSGLIFDSNSDPSVSNETNTIVENCLFQNFDYGIKTNFHSGNVVIFENNGFSHCKYAYYLDGVCKPLIINNTRMEWRREDTATGYGFYIKSNIKCNINNLNAYNIPVIFYNESDVVEWNGSFELSGETQSPTYILCDHNDGRFLNNASVNMSSSTYSVGNGWTNYINKVDNTTINDLTTNTLNLSPFDNRIYKTTSSIFYIFGRKGSKVYIYTESADKVIYGTVAGSTTQLFANPVTLVPYHLYTLYAVENNKFMILN